MRNRDAEHVDDADVIVAGGGNAALCAALSAREQGARVLLLERAPAYLRGGNSRHTRDIRYAHSAADAYVTGPYSDEEFTDDVLRVTGGQTDRDLLTLTIAESASIPAWMGAHGVRWQPPLKGTLHLARTNRFFLGGGKAMLNAYYDTASRLGVQVLYEAEVRDIQIVNGRCEGVEIIQQGETRTVRCKAFIVASGGFEANCAWLKRYWGDAADNFIIRGAEYNDGQMLAALLAHGATKVGNPRQFHAVAVDARAPRYDGGIVTRLDSVPFGIAVNQRGQRFYDEGEDLWPKRYAIWGGLIAEQPGQIAYSIFDAKVLDCFMPSVYPPMQASTLEDLAVAVNVDPATLRRTVDVFNAHIGRLNGFDPSQLDECGTRDLDPPKSHWAIPLDTAPFYAYPIRPGITFTYLGVAVDHTARVLDQTGTPYANIFAAGEVMAGNILSKGYLAGFGLTIGTVFGRIAGREAGTHVRTTSERAATRVYSNEAATGTRING